MQQIGAILDRGYVLTADENGKNRIESIERPGVLTLPLLLPEGVQPGDTVLFCEFLDGAAAVITKLR